VIIEWRWCSADDDLETVEWPNGADLHPLVLHGDFEQASCWARRFAVAPARRLEVAPLRVGCCV
jgi:hypothetical protein